MKIVLIRHGKTKGNVERRYVGTTNEGVLREELDRLKEYKWEFKNNMMLTEVAVSPMARCVDTATAILGGLPQKVVDNFKECNFGDYEYKNHEELKDYAEYQAYIDSNGEAPFPNGESKGEFEERCCKAFFSYIKDFVSRYGKEKDVAIVAHGGTIMAIMDRFSNPHKDYFEWQIENGKGIIANIDFVDENIIINNYNILEYN